MLLFWRKRFAELRYKDKAGDIWIGTRNGLYQYNSKTSVLNHFTTRTQPSIPNNWIYAINEDQEGIIWIGTWNGIASYSPQTGNITTYTIENINSVRSIANGKNGGIWIATERGLIFLDYKAKDGIATDLKSTHYRHLEDHNSINNDFLYTIAVDDDGYVWIGTAKGLCMYDPHEDKFMAFSDFDYISEIGIRGVICYKDNVWISYGKGLTRLNRKTFAVRHYDRLDGLQSNEFSEDAYYKNEETGELFFGGSNGLNTFYPDSITDNPHLAKVVFTDLRIQNKPVKVNQEINGSIVLKKPILITQELEFNHHNKEFEIEFSALHYSNPSKNRYAYQLEGFDKEWIPMNSTRRSAIYSGLPPGKYTLKVKAANSDGLWNNQPIEMQITILPPWWASGFAYTVYLLLIIVVCYLIIRNTIARKTLRHRVQLEQIKAEKAEEISRIRSTFFTGISHELRTPVTLIIDPLRKLVGKENENEETRKIYDLMYRNATRLLNLINQLLDFRKIESSGQMLRPVNQDIVAFVRNTLGMFEFTARKKNILLKLDTTFESHMLVFDPYILDKILVNLLSNAIKYSNAGTTVTVRLSVDSCFKIQVIDQGIGIPTEMKEKIFGMFIRVEDSNTIGSGIGLALTKELVQLHEGQITVDSKPGEGSCFTLSLPIILRPTPDIYNHELQIHPDEVAFDTLEMDGIEPQQSKGLSSPNAPLLLIVEDNKDIRKYIKDSLSDDYNVIIAGNGKEGVEKALEVIPDLIVSDVMMPEMSGIALCETLKTDERTSHIPVILLTARQSDEARIEGYETGADDYISKPFNSALLKIRIKNLIETRKKLRSLFGQATQMELKKISVNTTDEKFIHRAVDIVNLHMADLDFTPDAFAREMAVSRAQLFRKIKAMTNQTVQEFTLIIRLNRAAELLLTVDVQIADISLMCGFSDASNFRRSFVRQFGVTPSQYKKNNT